MDIEKFGPYIQSCRKRKQMTQEELAQKLHVTDKAISRWERGVGFPDVKLLEPLAEALDLSVAELLRSERMEQAGVQEPPTNEQLLTFADEGKRRAQYKWGMAACKAVTMILVIILAYYATRAPEPWWIHPLALILIWLSRLMAEQLLKRVFRPEVVKSQPVSYYVMFAIFGVGVMMRVLQRTFENSYGEHAAALWVQVGSVVTIAGLVGMFFNDNQLDI